MRIAASLLTIGSMSLVLVGQFSHLAKYCETDANGNYKLAFVSNDAMGKTSPVPGSTAQVGFCKAFNS